MQFISRVVVGRLEITADPWLDDLFPALVKHLEQHPPPPSAPAEEARLETDASSRLEHNNSSAPDSTVLDQPLEQLQLGNTDEQDGRGIASSSNRTVLRKGIDLKFKDRAELCKNEPNLIQSNPALADSSLSVPTNPQRYLQLNYIEEAEIVSAQIVFLYIKSYLRDAYTCMYVYMYIHV